jgi:hypothetical protein
MCCGVGNLEVKHSNHRNIFMSTLDEADIHVMQATKTCVAAHRFQYDYLNDDITDDGKIDYSLTNKIPQALRDAIASGKKILVLINPPYAEATNADNVSSQIYNEAKTDVATTKVAENMGNYGYANRELFTQFLVRISKEIPTAHIAMFSTMKYVNAPNFEKFRGIWSAEYLDGFVVHSKSFEGLTGNFPIGFLIWKSNQTIKNKIEITEITTEVLNKNVEPIGVKNFYNLPNSIFLNSWLPRLKTNCSNIPLKNAVSPRQGKAKVILWTQNALGYLLSNGNDVQHSATQTAILSSVYNTGGGFYITDENLWQAAIIFSSRRLVKPTWLNDRDQFLQPTEPLTNEFKNDCLIWMLFNGSNLTASANNLEWNDKKWSIVNHFIPYTEAEVNSPSRFESDFMVQYMADKTFSAEATTILAEGKKLWQAYFTQTDVRSVRDELKLNRPDVGWYQIRKALQARNASGDFVPTNFKPFEEAYKTLTEKLQPMVYGLGFLKS